MLFVFSIIVVTAGLGSRVEAQNYPWCAVKRLVSSTWRSYLTAQVARALLIVDARCKRMPPRAFGF
ncbi:MAG: hypothetical protein WCD52_00120 [Xanthobacteraceae bacterium]